MLTGADQQKLEVVHGILTEAARERAGVRVYLSDPSGADRPARIVEGMVVEVADGRDGRTRVRMSIPTGSGDPVEVRILVEGIERAESLAEPPSLDRCTNASTGPFRHASQERMTIPGIQRTSIVSAERNSADETGPRQRIK